MRYLLIADSVQKLRSKLGEIKSPFGFLALGRRSHSDGYFSLSASIQEFQNTWLHDYGPRESYILLLPKSLIKFFKIQMITVSTRTRSEFRRRK